MFSSEQASLIFCSEQASLIFILALNKLVLCLALNKLVLVLVLNKLVLCLALNKLVLVLALNKLVLVLKTRNIYHIDLQIILLGFISEQASCYITVQVVYVDCNPICVVEWFSCADLKIKFFQVIISSKNTFLNLVKTQKRYV